MSFYSNNCNPHPGSIQGDPTIGLHSRVCVNVERILDSCLKQINTDNIMLPLSNYTPSSPAPTPPFTFISATSAQIEGIITNLSINRLDERPCFARVKCTVITPLRVTFKDANDIEFSADSQIANDMDVIMYVPAPSIFPFEVKASSSCNCTSGVYIEPASFQVTACQTIVLKIIAFTDLLIPTYGFCPAPIAIDYEREACNDFFDLPLYPSGNSRQTPCK